jgi:hypothetical protein
MQFFVHEHCPMVAAPVQCDVDGIPKGSHCVMRIADGVDQQVSHDRHFSASGSTSSASESSPVSRHQSPDVQAAGLDICFLA